MSTEAVAPNFFTGNNVDTTFSVTDASEIASTIEFSATQLYLYDGGFTKNTVNNTITLSEVPPLNSQGIVPGNVTVTFNSYDQANVAGSTTANVDVQDVFWGDVDEIQLYGYRPRHGSYAIPISFVDAITSAGADLSWVQLACCDANGNALTYAATGQPIYTPSLDQFGVIAASSALNTTTISCLAASTFILGDYIFINKGNPTQEIRKLISVSGTTMTFATSFTYNHYINETLYACVRQFKAKQTTPINVTNGLAANYIDLYLLAQSDQIRRF